MNKPNSPCVSVRLDSTRSAASRRVRNKYKGTGKVDPLYAIKAYWRSANLSPFIFNLVTLSHQPCTEQAHCCPVWFT